MEVQNRTKANLHTNTLGAIGNDAKDVVSRLSGNHFPNVVVEVGNYDYRCDVLKNPLTVEVLEVLEKMYP